jgi:hypothetical protein
MADFREDLYAQYRSAPPGTVLPMKRKALFAVFDAYYGALLPNDKTAPLIDIACGGGELVSWLRSKGYANAEGVDLGAEQVETAAADGTTVHRADFRDYLAARGGAYERIFAIDILEHFTKEELIPIGTMLHDSLREHGMLVLKTLNAESVFGRRLAYSDLTHMNAFTAASMSQWLKVSRFPSFQFFEAGPVPHGIRSTLRAMLWKLMRPFLQLYFLIEIGAAPRVLTQDIIAVAKK